MDKFFPIMIERPENRLMGNGLTYWFFAFSLFPCLMFLMSADIFSWNDWMGCIEIIYHIINFAVVILLFFTFLKESFLIVQVNTKQVFSTACACTIVIIAIKRAILSLCSFMGWEYLSIIAYGSLISSEMDMLRFASDVLYIYPLIGAAVLIVLVPFSISCLYYACCFAPACNRWPRAAYLIVSLALLVPRFMNFWPLSEEIPIYLFTLPTHLIACWGYQKTDTIWTPILIHGLTNLLSSIFLLHAFGMI